jgi:hypothetical protein
MALSNKSAVLSRTLPPSLDDLLPKSTRRTQANTTSVTFPGFNVETPVNSGADDRITIRVFVFVIDFEGKQDGWNSSAAVSTTSGPSAGEESSSLVKENFHHRSWDEDFIIVTVPRLATVDDVVVASLAKNRIGAIPLADAYPCDEDGVLLPIPVTSAPLLRSTSPSFAAAPAGTPARTSLLGTERNSPTRSASMSLGLPEPHDVCPPRSIGSGKEYDYLGEKLDSQLPIAPLASKRFPITLAVISRPSALVPSALVNRALRQLHEYQWNAHHRSEKLQEKERRRQQLDIVRKREANEKRLTAEGQMMEVRSILHAHKAQELFQIAERERKLKARAVETSL